MERASDCTTLLGSIATAMNLWTWVRGIIWVLALFEMTSAYLMISAAMCGIDPSVDDTATKVIYDKYHATRYVAEALNQVRRQEHKALQA